MSITKKFIKTALKGIGLKISKIPKPGPSHLVNHKVELLFDVGANSGQFAMSARTGGYAGTIVSFEPLPDAHEALRLKSEIDPLWIVHSRCALGAEFGEVEINISRNSVSSSILPMLEAHSSAAPESVYIGQAITDVITLDSVFDTYRTRGERTFLKIDTQGFEREVLNGLAINLKNIFAVQLELSIVPLYANQDLYEYFFSFFKANGFTLWDLIPAFSNEVTGQLLQFDAVFIRSI